MHRPVPLSGLPAGTVRPIARWGEAVLHTRPAPVTSFDTELAELVADLFATMDAADGVGLAANQIGVAQSLFVFDIRLDGGEGTDERAAGDPIAADDAPGHSPASGVVCNPVLQLSDDAGQAWLSDEEGCLSLPGAFVPSKRALMATVTGVDHHGQPVGYTASGFLARCFQHETDHLDGVVFADRLSGWQRRRLQRQAARYAADYPDDWPVSAGLDDPAD